MALTVRPSRGTIAFFALLIIAVLVYRTWEKRTAQEVQRDSPPAHDARYFVRCLIGRDAQRYLGLTPRATMGQRTEHPWAPLIHRRLALLATQPPDPQWPARCETVGQRLLHRLHLRPDAVQVRARTASVVTALSSATTRVELMRLIDDPTFSNAVALMLDEMRTLSGGASQGFGDSIPNARTDLWPLPVIHPPVPVAIANEPVDSTTFAMPELLLYQDLRTRRVHTARFGNDARLQSSHDLAPGAPVRGPQREGAMLLASDDGDRIFLPGGEPRPVVPMPSAIREGHEAALDWHIALTRTRFWLLTDDDGALQIRVLPRNGEHAWQPPVATIGGHGMFAGAVMAPVDGSQDAVRVTALRRSAAGVWLEQYTVSSGTPVVAQASAPQPATTATTPSTATQAPPARSDASTGTREVFVVSAPTSVLPEVEAFAPEVTHCSSGAIRYLALRTDEGIAVMRIEGTTASQLRHPFDPMRIVNLPRRHELQCDEQRALLRYEAPNNDDLVLFDYGVRQAIPIMPPMTVAPDSLHAAALAGTDTVVVVTGRQSIRSFATTDRGGSWTGGSLVALPGYGVGWRVASIASAGEQLALVGVRSSDGFVVRLAARGAPWVFRGASE